MHDDGPQSTMRRRRALNEERLWRCVRGLRWDGNSEYLLLGKNEAVSLGGDAETSMKAEAAGSGPYPMGPDGQANAVFVRASGKTRAKSEGLLDATPNGSAAVPGNLKRKIRLQ